MVQNTEAVARRVALITGVTGQDGAYLAEFLLKKGYEVHGVKRRASQFNTQRIDHLYQDPHEAEVRFVLHYGDLTDSTNLIRIVQEVQPDEVYNLGAQSHVQVSFETPEYTANADAVGTLRLYSAPSGTNSVFLREAGKCSYRKVRAAGVHTLIRSARSTSGRIPCCRTR